MFTAATLPVSIRHVSKRKLSTEVLIFVDSAPQHRLFSVVGAASRNHSAFYDQNTVCMLWGILVTGLFVHATILITLNVKEVALKKGSLFVTLLPSKGIS